MVRKTIEPEEPASATAGTPCFVFKLARFDHSDQRLFLDRDWFVVVHADVVFAIHIVSHDEVVGGGEAVGLRELVVLLDHARQRVGAVGVFSSRGPLTLTRLWTSFIALFAVQVITNICYAYELLA